MAMIVSQTAAEDKTTIEATRVNSVTLADLHSYHS